MPTIITRTIDAGGGGDYTTFTAAEAAVSTLVTTDDMVANDEAIVFECVAGTYNESVTFDSSTPGPALTMDATRNITYRAAAGSEHGGDLNSGVIIESTSITAAVEEDHLVLEGLVLTSTGSYVLTTSAEGLTFRNLIMSGGSTAVTIIQQPSGSTLANTFENCLSYNTGGYGYYVFGTSNPSIVVIRNCTNIVSSGTYGIRNYGDLADLELHNYLGIVTSGAAYQAVGSPAISGSATNISSAAGALPSSQQLNSTGWTFSTDPQAASTGSQVIYDASTGAMLNVPGNDAVGVGTTTGAPTTDINGEERIRGTYADPGAFVAPLRTITKSIDGDGGGDYTTFTAAEAAVSSLVTAADMVQRNEAIVFEAEAGTYSESVTVDPSTPGPALTMDATHNITYRAAAGSEHGGVFGGGVFIDGTAFATIWCLSSARYTRFDSLSVGGSGIAVYAQADGVIVSSCMLESTGSTGVQLGDAGIPAAPITLQNSVIRGASGNIILCRHSSTDTYCRVTNCTVLGAGTAVRAGAFSAGVVLDIELVNVVALHSGQVYSPTATGLLTVTGSGNVGGASSPFPAALQASSQTWTFSTDTQAASTGSLAIYDATNGALLNVPGNDAVGVGTSTGAPATDILGKERLREGSYGAFYADPGAFTTDRVDLGGTVGVGKDYATYTAAEAVTGGYANLPKSNVRYVFTATPGETISESNILEISNSGETGPNHNVRFQCLDKTNRAKRLQPTNADAIRVLEGFVEWDGIDIEAGNRSLLYQTVSGVDTVGTRFSNCVLDCPGYGVDFDKIQPAENQGSATHPHTFENVLTTGTRLLTSFVATAAHTGGAYFVFRNCTRLNDTPSNTFLTMPSATTTGMPFSTIEVYNCLDLAPGTEVEADDYLGSGNVGCGSGLNSKSFTNLGIGVNYTRTTDTQAASTGSQVIYDASTGAMVDAPGNDAWKILTDLSVAPTTDIEGVTREATGYNPGAFERTAAEVGTPIGGTGGIRAACLRGSGIRQPLIRGEALRGPC